MPLKQTHQLIEEFGEEFKSGEISDARFVDLIKRFSKSGDLVAHDIVSDSNFNRLDGMCDFVQTIGPTLSVDQLHDITSRLIKMLPANITGGQFMHEESLAKTFLVYEMCHHPTHSQLHFAPQGQAFLRINAKSNQDFDQSEIAELIEMIRKPLSAYFKANTIIPDGGMIIKPKNNSAIESAAREVVRRAQLNNELLCKHTWRNRGFKTALASYIAERGQCQEGHISFWSPHFKPEMTQFNKIEAAKKMLTHCPELLGSNVAPAVFTELDVKVLRDGKLGEILHEYEEILPHAFKAIEDHLQVEYANKQKVRWWR